MHHGIRNKSFALYASNSNVVCPLYTTALHLILFVFMPIDPLTFQKFLFPFCSPFFAWPAPHSNHSFHFYFHFNVSSKLLRFCCDIHHFRHFRISLWTLLCSHRKMMMTPLIIHIFRQSNIQYIVCVFVVLMFVYAFVCFQYPIDFGSNVELNANESRWHFSRQIAKALML